MPRAKIDGVTLEYEDSGAGEPMVFVHGALITDAFLPLLVEPALVVLGEESATLHPRFAETHRLLLEWLRDSEGFVLPGATHFLQMASPHPLAHALGEFFERHALPRPG